MEKTFLKAIERNEKVQEVRAEGFIPGVLNASDTTSTSVKFETLALNKIINKHGSNAKIWVELGNQKIFGFIKEIQKSPVEQKILHISIQLVSKDKETKMQLPIYYHGQSELAIKFLMLQVYKTEVEVIGKAELLPDMVSIDVSGKKLGDNITASDLNLPAELKILDQELEVYAVIKAVKEAAAEPSKEAKPAE